MTKNDKAAILIVDDKPANILVLENLLTDKDRVIRNASSGEEALKIALNNNIDLIMLDVQMPDMDGFEVAQILKSNKRTKDIPIIFVTAESKERNLVMKGYDEGAIDYLFKPLDPEVVKAKVGVLLKIQLQKKELVEKNLSLEKSALLINNSADIIGIIDAATFVIEEINDAVTAVLEYSPAEVKGNSLAFFLSEEDSALLQELGHTGKEQLSFETRVYCKSKTLKWLQWKVTVKNGKWFAYARDITEQKIANERISQLNTDLRTNVSQLELINKELESFSYSVSHDLRAPLRALSGYSNIIKEDYSVVLDDEGKRLLGNIQDNARKMGMLIDDLLSFSRLGRKAIQKEKTDMQELLKKVLGEIDKSTHHRAKIKIHSLLPVEADQVLLQQVWINLISNAIKYSGKKEEPEIEIGSEEAHSEIVYYVKDNGSGFDMNYAHKLFGVFQRLHSSDEFEGTGVGLAIVNKIIVRHGGRVWAEAKPGEGASFYFSLPKKTSHI